MSKSELTAEQYKLKSKIITNGFINNASKTTEIQIPTEIVALIFLFYYIDDRFIAVFCRFKPEYDSLNDLNHSHIQISNDNRNVKIKYSIPEIIKEFNFNHIFDQNKTNNDIYKQIGSSFIQSIFNGYNTSIICYGQTDSGKTYTINGFISNIIKQIFINIQNNESKSKSNSKKYIVKASYIEIFKEQIRDLLQSDLNAALNNLKIRQNREGVYIENVTEKTVSSYQDTNELIENGNLQKRRIATFMSIPRRWCHVIFMMKLIEHDTSTEVEMISNIKFVKMSGSERPRKTGVTGAVLKESQRIRRAIPALGHVVCAIVAENKYIPYRDSKITRILTNELGGNCKTFCIINCNSSSNDVLETIATCRFGHKMKKIRNCPKINKRKRQC